METLKTILYWVWSCTWGCIMTLIGAIIALVLFIGGKQPLRFHYSIYFQFGSGWGGVSFGPFFFLSTTSPDSTKQHEAGHSLQNLIFGPLMPFVVGIPSAVRCMIRSFSFTGKKVASGIITALAAAVGLVVAVLGFVYGLPVVGVLGLLLAVYAGILAVWLFKREIPQYTGGAYVDYDAVWFEGCATRWGETAFPL